MKDKSVSATVYVHQTNIKSFSTFTGTINKKQLLLLLKHKMAISILLASTDLEKLKYLMKLIKIKFKKQKQKNLKNIIHIIQCYA